MGIFAFLFLTDETIDSRLPVADLKTAQNNHENFPYNPHILRPLFSYTL